MFDMAIPPLLVWAPSKSGSLIERIELEDHERNCPEGALLRVLGILDSVIIVISLALVVGAVLRAAGKKQTDAEYFLAGRDLRWPFIGMSLLASNISAEHVVGLAGDGYRVGMVTGGFEWMAAWCLIILASLFVPLYLRSRIYTIPEFLERRFGWGLRAFLSGNLLVMNVLTKNAIDLWAGSLLLVLLFGWNQTGGHDRPLHFHRPLHDEGRPARRGLRGHGAGHVAHRQQHRPHHRRPLSPLADGAA